VSHSTRRCTRSFSSILVVAALAGCATSGSTFIAGHYGPDDAIPIKNMTIDAGRYRIGYALRMRVESSVPDALITCSLIDSSGQFGRLEQTTTQVPADGTWSKAEYFARYSLPDVTVGIRCSPDRLGDYSITVSDVDLYAKPLGAGDSLG